MNINKIGVRYAKALVSLSIEKNITSEVYLDVQLLNDTFNMQTQLSHFFLNPTVKTSRKIQLIKNVYKDNISELTLNFILLVIKKGRELFLKDIFRNFFDFYRKLNKIKEVKLITHQEISEDTKENIIKLISKYLTDEYSVDIQHTVDNNLLGGFIMNVENKELDLSVKSQIELIKRNLINKTYQVKL